MKSLPLPPRTYTSDNDNTETHNLTDTDSSPASTSVTLQTRAICVQYTVSYHAPTGVGTGIEAIVNLFNNIRARAVLCDIN